MDNVPSSKNPVICLSVSDTAARFEIPERLRGRVCRFLVDGGDADVLFGGAAVECAIGQASDVTSEAITEDAQTGGHLENGIAHHWRVPKDSEITHFSVDASVAAKLYIEVI